MRSVLQEDRVEALVKFSEARAKGGILKGRGGATRSAAAPRDAKGRDRKVLQTHGARGRARFADTSSAEDVAERGESASLGEEEGGPLRASSSESSGSDASSADTVAGTKEKEEEESELRIGMEQSYQEELVQRVLEELHDFGASSQWVLQVMSSRARGRVRGRAGALPGSLSLSDSGL